MKYIQREQEKFLYAGITALAEKYPNEMKDFIEEYQAHIDVGESFLYVSRWSGDDGMGGEGEYLYISMEAVFFVIKLLEAICKSGYVCPRHIYVYDGPKNMVWFTWYLDEEGRKQFEIFTEFPSLKFEWVNDVTKENSQVNEFKYFDGDGLSKELKEILKRNLKNQHLTNH